jgi:hypothetical protein
MGYIISLFLGALLGGGSAASVLIIRHRASMERMGLMVADTRAQLRAEIKYRGLLVEESRHYKQLEYLVDKHLNDADSTKEDLHDAYRERLGL